ncbi:hypothetical protein TNCV_2198981 [Trichonephila clavipes]|nr:hypothetical protein TNCV_2198981 [Trichonephila clavipes]
MFFFAETCYVVHFNNPMMALSKVLQRKDKVFFLDINGKRVSVSIDRCKPAFFLNTEDFQLPQTKNETPCYCGTLMQQLQYLLLWNLIQQLQRLPSHLHVLVAKFIFQLGIVDTGRGVCSDLTAQHNDSKTELN